MVEIRALEPEDWRAWRALRLRALEESPEAFSSTLEGTLARDGEDGAAREAYWRGYFRLPGQVYMATRTGGDCEPIPAGMARLVTAESSGAPAEILSVWVAPEHRGHGVGRALIGACVDHLAAHHPTTRLRLAVVETNAPARRLYESCGFGVVGRNPDDDVELLMEHAPSPCAFSAAARGTEPGA